MLQVTSNWFDGSQHRIVLQENEPDLLLIPMRFNEDLTGVPDNEIIDKVMEKFYRERFESKFMSEAVDTVEQVKNEMLTLVDKYKAMVTEGESTINTIKEDAVITQGSVMEATEMIFDHEVRLSTLEDAINEEHNTTIEGGE